MIKLAYLLESISGLLTVTKLIISRLGSASQVIFLMCGSDYNQQGHGSQGESTKHAWGQCLMWLWTLPGKWHLPQELKNLREFNQKRNKGRKEYSRNKEALWTKLQSQTQGADQGQDCLLHEGSSLSPLKNWDKGGGEAWVFPHW